MSLNKPHPLFFHLTIGAVVDNKIKVFVNQSKVLPTFENVSPQEKVNSSAVSNIDKSANSSDIKLCRTVNLMRLIHGAHSSDDYDYAECVSSTSYNGSKHDLIAILNKILGRVLKHEEKLQEMEWLTAEKKAQEIMYKLKRRESKIKLWNVRAKKATSITVTWVNENPTKFLVAILAILCIALG